MKEGKKNINTHMAFITQLPQIQYLINSIEGSNEGYLLTLVGLTKSRFLFEQQLLNFSVWLNDYSLGKAFKNKTERLQIFGSIERGKINNRLHAHLIIKGHEKVRRTDQELNAFIRKSWIKLIQAKASPMSTLIDFQRTHDLRAAATYALKDVRSSSSENLIYI